VLTTLIEKIQAHTTAAEKDNAVASKDDAEKTRVTIEAGVTGDNTSTIEDTTRTVAAWNETWPVGTRVSCKNHDDVLETRTQAIMLFGRKATIYMQGYKGYFDLADVQPVVTEK